MNKIVKKIFWRTTQFTISIRRKKNDKDSLFNERKFVSEIEFPFSKDYWTADPMLIEQNNKTFIFYEACHNGKGVIEVRELFLNGTISNPTIVLEKDYHLSYPFVFNENSDWYMIPESCSDNSIQLYKAINFPYVWKMDRIILKEHAVDTTLFKLEDGYILTTFIMSNKDETVKQKVYKLKKLNEKPLEIKCAQNSDLRVRGAGKYFIHDNRIYRPSQSNKINSYGDGIIFNEVLLFDNEYRENELFEINSDSILFNKSKIDGLHTYTSTKQWEAIDVRCGYFDVLKPIKKILNCTIRNR